MLESSLFYSNARLECNSEDSNSTEIYESPYAFRIHTRRRGIIVRAQLHGAALLAEDNSEMRMYISEIL